MMLTNPLQYFILHTGNSEVYNTLIKINNIDGTNSLPNYGHSFHGPKDTQS